MKLLKRGILLLTMMVGCRIAAAQSNFAPGDKVIFVARSSPVYTSATSTNTNAGEISRGTPSRINSVDQGHGRIYLIDYAYGWVDILVDGQPSVVPYDESVFTQISEQAQSAITATPADTAAYVAAALVAKYTNRTQDAIDLLNRAVTQSPNDGYLRYQRGSVYLHADQWSQALGDLQTAVALNYKTATAYSQIGIDLENSIEPGMSDLPDSKTKRKTVLIC